jgi:Tfp pilus assembly protein PilV
MSKRYLSQTGLSLLEVTVAVAIAGIVFVPLISLVSTGIKMEDYARRLTEATMIAETRLKEIERNPYPEMGQAEGLVDPLDPAGFRYRQVIKGSPLEDVRTIEMEVFWDNKRSSVLLATYLAKR